MMAMNTLKGCLNRIGVSFFGARASCPLIAGRMPALLLVVLCLVTIGQTAQAEGVLIKSSPPDYAQVQGFKGEVKLWFSGNISERFPSLVVVDGNGKRVDNADLQLQIDKRSQLSATTAPLPPGPYVIRYRVVTEDGLVVSGIQHFSVAH
jgi:methionine-rich copper-binding protein CopC